MSLAFVGRGLAALGGLMTGRFTAVSLASAPYLIEKKCTHFSTLSFNSNYILILIKLFSCGVYLGFVFSEVRYRLAFDIKNIKLLKALQFFMLL